MTQEAPSERPAEPTGQARDGADEQGPEHPGHEPEHHHAQHHAQHRAPGPWREQRGSFKHAAVIIAVATAMVSLFALSYIDALGRPVARALPVAVVGDATGSPFLEELERATSHGLELRQVDSAAQGERLVQLQEVYAVIAPGETSAQGREQVRMELSSASGASAARVLTQAALTAESSSGVELSTTDLHPLPSSDPSGLASFYLTITATILGFVTTFQLRAHASPLTLRGWAVVAGSLVVLGSLVLATLAIAVLDVPLPFWETWWALALQVLTASSFAALMSVLVGRWAILPTWALFILLGNTSSGGAVAPGLLPEPFSTLSRVLPSGALVSALRAAAYFNDTQRWEPRLVLLAWAVTTTTALVLVCRARRTSPAP
ncbi:ABC transporter permease [Quadrisphaera setariae]|uniref:DUF3533 domain-containing protein n=1 Tax=Quadrisphaera setariae TaxID=2593304 RepID=A0A5C8ZL89_9ACTN|nr:ABC transporter permease [Quadrisphaera setariae]TXR57931.1 DUF3533 domain-containing protein [Quadrisphaera setariae]